MSGPRFTREPLATYDQALWRFIGQYGEVSDLLHDGDALPLAAQIICDVFWVTDAQFRADLKKYWYQLTGGYRRCCRSPQRGGITRRICGFKGLG